MPALVICNAAKKVTAGGVEEKSSPAVLVSGKMPKPEAVEPAVATPPELN